MSSKTFPADMSGLDGSLEFVRQQLKAMGVGKKEVASAMLATEESLIGLIGHAGAASGDGAGASSAPTVSVSVSKWLGNVSIRLSARGERFDLTVDTPFGLRLALDDAGFDAEAAIRNTILRSFGDKLQYKCRGGVNTVRILVKKSERKLSIVSCVSQFGNFSEFGKMGAKTLGFYMTTTFIAILVGGGIFALLHPGDPSLMASV